MRTWVLNIRDGVVDSPEGEGHIGAVWTIAESARAVRIQGLHEAVGS